MFKKILIGLLILLLIAFAYVQLIFVPNVDAQMNGVIDLGPYEVSEEAKALHDTLYIADLHADSLMWRRDTTKRHDRGHVDLPRLREGGVELQVFSSVTKSPRGLNFAENAADAPDDITLVAVAQLWPIRTWQSIYERAAYQAQRLAKYEADGSNNLVIAREASDLDQPDGTIVGLLLTEGAHPLEGKIENVQRLFDEGYRAMGLQHFFDNELGGSLHGQSQAGLTEFGFDAVREMWRLNIAVDLAHASEQVSRDVLAMPERGPVFISHGGVRDECTASQQRNLPDDVLTQISARGGIVGIGYFEGAICDISPEGIAKAMLSAIDLMGIEAVALGSDYDGTVATAFDTSELAVITHQLLGAGLSEPDIRAIMGLNALRFFKQSLPGSTMIEAESSAPTADTELAINAMRALSADDMAGRAGMTDGNVRARNYIISAITDLTDGTSPELHNYSYELTRGGNSRTIEGTNIILPIAGKSDGGPVLEITAHFDHLGTTDAGEIYNGADDNASGVGALLSILESFQDNPTEHDTNLIWLDTEELGLGGARRYVAERLDDRPRLNLNLDMIGQNKDGEIFGSGTYHYPALASIVEQAAKGTGLIVRLGHDRPEDGPGDWTNQSDHAAFHAVGIPFLYFGVEDHPHYHQPSDTFDTIPLETYRKTVQLAVNAAHLLDDNLDALAQQRVSEEEMATEP